MSRIVCHNLQGASDDLLFLLTLMRLKVNALMHSEVCAYTHEAMKASKLPSSYSSLCFILDSKIYSLVSNLNICHIYDFFLVDMAATNNNLEQLYVRGDFTM